jgi:hypothetical protein
MSSSEGHSAAAPGFAWPTFAGILLLAVGAIEVAAGIFGLVRSRHFSEPFFWGKPLWGVVLLAAGGLSVYGAYTLLTRLPGSRTIGVLVAVIALAIQILAWPGLGAAWAVVVIVMAGLVLYALLAHPAAATPPV